MPLFRCTRSRNSSCSGLGVLPFFLHSMAMKRPLGEQAMISDMPFSPKASGMYFPVKRFFQRKMANPGNSIPWVINVNQNRAYPAAVDELKKDGTIRRCCKLRPCKYLNNVVEQDHRNVKRRTWLAKGYGSVPTAWRTLRGIEAMDKIRKGRVRRAGKGDVVAQVKFISKLFGIAV
jgi:transposase, IS6 family